MKIIKQSVELLWITPEPEKKIECAGRTCYKSEDKITEKSASEFCGRMKKNGHYPMLEHASASFRIVTDRGISHEIVRHRIASYAQESTRYCNYSKDKFSNECSFIEPPNLTGFQRVHWQIACKIAERNYFNLLESGCTPQIARSVLPTCLKTEIVMTCNLREWMYFIQLRGSKAAHPQIRVIANSIEAELKTVTPSIF